MNVRELANARLIYTFHISLTYARICFFFLMLLLIFCMCIWNVNGVFRTKSTHNTLFSLNEKT